LSGSETHHLSPKRERLSAASPAQPFAVQGQVGLNIAASVAGIELRYVR
jgi:hypothetical protein